MTRASIYFDPEVRLCAAALAGDLEALETLANSNGADELAAAHRIGPGLAIRAAEADVQGSQVESWNEQMRTAAANRMRLAASMDQLSEALEKAKIPWAPFKGMGLNPEIYPHPEERISTDLDVLISPEHLDAAITTLEEHGFRSLYPTARHRAFLKTEGYNWKAAYGNDLLLELHYGLWGGVPNGLGQDVLDRALPAPELGATAHRVQSADAYLLAAVHIWQTSPPRYLTLWWDLHLLGSAMDDQTTNDVINRATEYGLQAFVAPAAGATDNLWNDPNNHLIAARLKPHLRYPERWAAIVRSQSSPIRASLKVVTISRLLANRPSRTGWKAVARQIWAHPAIVERDTPETWPWSRRRLVHLARKLRIFK